MKKEAKNNNFLLINLGVIISLFCLWLAIRKVTITELNQLVKGANYSWLVPALILMLASIMFRAERWKVLLQKRVTLTHSFWAQNIGFLFTNIFPLRLGEPARIASLAAANRHLTVIEVTASAGLERLLDLVMVVLMVVVILPFMTVPAMMKQATQVMAGLGVCLFFVIIILVKSGKRGEDFFHGLMNYALPRHAHKVTAHWGTLIQSLAVLFRLSVGVPAFGLSVLVWGCAVASQWCLLKMFQPVAGPIEAFFMVSSLAMAVAVPASPGFIGVYEWVGQKALVIPFSHMYTASTALGIAVMAHAAYFFVTTGLGIIALWFFGQSFFSLRQTLSGKSKPVEEVNTTF